MQDTEDGPKISKIKVANNVPVRFRPFAGDANKICISERQKLYKFSNGKDFQGEKGVYLILATARKEVDVVFESFKAV
jgi:hypothetical protein